MGLGTPLWDVYFLLVQGSSGLKYGKLFPVLNRRFAEAGVSNVGQPLCVNKPRAARRRGLLDSNSASYILITGALAGGEFQLPGDDGFEL